MGIGVVADGNRAPAGNLLLAPISNDLLGYTATVVAEDPDGDPITSYIFDWGDGTVVETPFPEMDHTYAAPGDYALRTWFVDSNGAPGFADGHPASLMESRSWRPPPSSSGNSSRWK